MTISQKDSESFVNAIRSMTEKFITLFESHMVSNDFSWFKFRDETLLNAIQHSFGELTKEEFDTYGGVFNSVMVEHGYSLTAVNYLDDKVELWHNTPSLNMELHEYLGIPWGDYHHFMFGRDVYLKK